MQPIGILGGTFDPIHFGHLRLAEEMAEGLHLSHVRFIPAGFPPHRVQPQARPSQRLEMVKRAIAGNPLFCADEREIAKPAPCYSVETLADLRRELGAQQPLCLLLGADAFLGLNTWHNWREIFALAHIAVAQRPGYPLAEQAMPDELKRELELRWQDDGAALAGLPAGRIVQREIAALAISATRIRRQIKAGESPRYLLPDAVLDYIREQHIYS
ncbi:MAG: nicotinate-nucleotide adenylyltransferase [Sulfuricellaceae bacterium]|nr:nicotinate-nucleotide adenylyltransferase [Sulfuricellaceae bacterium]